MISKLICYFKGHKRGKVADDVACLMDHRAYRCPRCKATWTRKVKA